MLSFNFLSQCTVVQLSEIKVMTRKYKKQLFFFCSLHTKQTITIHERKYTQENKFYNMLV